jgi:hypothetical protein
MSNSRVSAPFPTDNSVYPYNHVTQTRSGHVFEVDDTLGAARIKEKHQAGTYYEVAPDGSKTTIVVGNNYTTICGEDSVTIVGDTNVNIGIAGSASNANITVYGNVKMEVAGNYDLEVKGEYRLKCGTYKNEVLGDKAENVVGKKDSVIGNGVNNTVRAGGVKSMVVGSCEKTVLGGYTGIYTGSADTTALLGVSMSSPAGPATIGGLSAAVDSATVCNITSLGMTNMTSSLTNMTTSVVTVLGGGVVAAGDVRAAAGTTGLLTHLHLGDGSKGIPTPTVPGALG